MDLWEWRDLPSVPASPYCLLHKLQRFCVWRINSSLLWTVRCLLETWYLWSLECHLLRGLVEKALLWHLVRVYEDNWKWKGGAFAGLCSTPEKKQQCQTHFLESSLPARLKWFSEILRLLVRALLGRLRCEFRKCGKLTSVPSGVAQSCCITEPSQVLHDVLLSFLLL